jgi:hypothetical protein
MQLAAPLLATQLHGSWLLETRGATFDARIAVLQFGRPFSRRGGSIAMNITTPLPCCALRSRTLNAPTSKFEL